jgi:hypothetical protein
MALQETEGDPNGQTNAMRRPVSRARRRLNVTAALPSRIGSPDLTGSLSRQIRIQFPPTYEVTL